MKKKLIVCLVILFSVGLCNFTHADTEKRRQELIELLDEELKEVTRVNKQTGGAKPEFMLRMGQILLEKGRLLRDLENQKFLEIPQDERAKLNRDEHFKNSARYFEQAQKTVLVLLSKFKNFDEKAEAYYILAFNAKEQKQDEKAKKFFEMSLQVSKGESVITDKSRIALAEIYFNKGSFDKAKDLYEAAIKVKRDKWWTKDAFNLGWSYFKIGQYNKAIQMLNESYELSKSNKYIDMSRSIERDMAYFYTEAGKIDEGVQFYKKNGKNISEVLLKVGRYLKTQGKFTVAEKALTQALLYKQNDKEEADINLELLSLYDKFGRESEHLEACKSLVKQFDKGALAQEQIDILKFNTQKMGAIIQKGIVEKTFNHNLDLLKKKTQAAITYFMIDAKLNPAKAQSSFFLAGETFYAINDFDNAVQYYAESIKLAQKNNDKEIEAKAGHSLMASLGKGVKKETQETYLVPAYEAYLTSKPKDEKSAVIYQRLFSAYFEKKDLSGAQKTLYRYRENFPQDHEPQERMLAEVMDHYKKSNDKKALMEFANKIEAGEFRVTPEYRSKVKALMLGMQFESVEQSSQKGDKKGALKGYLQIYKSPDSSADAKRTAAYNIAVLFYETNDGRNLYQWSERAVQLMTVEELIKFEKDFIMFTTDLFQRRMFKESSSLSEKLFDKVCTSNSKNKKVFFKNANVIYVSEREFDKSRAIIQKASGCSLDSSFIADANLDLLNELAESQKWGSFNDVIKSLENDKMMHAKLIYPVSILANELELIGRADEARNWRARMVNYYDVARKAKLDISLEGLDAIALMRLPKLESELKNLNQIKLAFPEDKYNQALKLKFKALEKLTTSAIEIAEIGSGIGIVKSYKFLVQGHESLVKEISDFIPSDKSEEYVRSFKKGMSGLVVPIEKQAKDFRKAAIKKIETENILSSDNSWFIGNVNLPFSPEFFVDKHGVLMDRGGAR